MVMYRVHHFKSTQQQSRTTVQKQNQKQFHYRVINYPNLPMTVESVTLIARLLLMPVAQTLCRCENCTFKSRTLFIVEYYFALKPFAGVMRYWVHPDASTSYTHQNNTLHTIHTATVINIHIRRATENRGNVTNLIYIYQWNMSPGCGCM
jgi:hypothetical protein